MILTIIILSILTLTLGYGVYNLLGKLEVYEDAIDASDKGLIEIQESLRAILSRIRAIDNKGIFENDDEVGQTFKQIADVIKSIEEKDE